MRSSGHATGKPGTSSPWCASTSRASSFDHAAARLATAVFEYRKGRWNAEGKRLDEIRPDQAVGRNRRYEPVAVGQVHSKR